MTERKKSSLKFTNLHGHDTFSIFDGMGYPDEHIDFAYGNGLDGMAFTNHGNMNSFSYALMKSKKMKEEGAHVEIVSFLDTGRSSMIRLREYEGDPPFSTKCFGLEFRGFSFDGGEAQAQLLEALGTIGTAMKAHLCQHAERKLLALPFTLDGRLAKVWQKFEKEVTIIYQQYKRIPSLFNADSWIVKKDDENKERKLEELTGFYITLSSELDKENGLVVQMQRLIKKTSEEVESILES